MDKRGVNEDPEGHAGENGRHEHDKARREAAGTVIRKIIFYIKEWSVPVISGIAGGVIGTVIVRTLLGL